MKLTILSLVTSVFLISSASSALAIGNAGGVNGGITQGGGVNNGGAISPVPDGGSSLLLLALGCAGLAVVAGKRSKGA